MMLSLRAAKKSIARAFRPVRQQFRWMRLTWWGGNG